MINRLLVTCFQMGDLDLALVIYGGVYKTSSKDCVLGVCDWCWWDIYQSIRLRKGAAVNGLDKMRACVPFDSDALRQ